MPSEIELKLLLPGANPKTIAQTLARHPALARRPRQEKWLTNIYFDTPEQALRQQRSALRLRHVADKPAGHGKWLQTFKTAGTSQGGLSQRGEWETPVAGRALDLNALEETPFHALLADDTPAASLAPCFETHCHRTTWLVRKRDGSTIEVALDIGRIIAGQQQEPMLELELELLTGPVDALFELAQSLARHIAVLPSDASKAERGYALAAGHIHSATRARLESLAPGTPPIVAASQSMTGMYDHFTRNLAALLHSDQPEVVHQARVAWRRWRSALRFFRPWLPAEPDRAGLSPLLGGLCRLRDLDVARTETLPHWADAYIGGNPGRRKSVTSAQAMLNQASKEARHTARLALSTPGTSQVLLAHAAWLYTLRQPVSTTRKSKKQSTWARERMGKLQRRLAQAMDAARQPAATEEMGHDARLLAKRARYNIEALQGLLPRDKAKRWLKAATATQLLIGAQRDLQQAAVVLEQLGAEESLVAFLRGAAAGGIKSNTQ